jgi:hypothetical protein
VRLLANLLAWLLILTGFLILLLPGPAGWPGLLLMIPGLLLLMRSSRGARKWFAQAARQDPRIFGRVRQWLRTRRRNWHIGRARREDDTRPDRGAG